MQPVPGILEMHADRLRWPPYRVTFRAPHDQSMVSLIRPGQVVTVHRVAAVGSPQIAGLTAPADLKPGDIVLARVAGATRLHMIIAVDRDRRRVLTGGCDESIDGWAGWDEVHGIYRADEGALVKTAATT